MPLTCLTKNASYCLINSHSLTTLKKFYDLNNENNNNNYSHDRLTNKLIQWLILTAEYYANN